MISPNLKPMKKIIFILLCSVFCIVETPATAQNNTRQKSCIIKYDLISLLGDQVSNSMGVRLGLEYTPLNNQSFETDIMYIFPCSSCGQSYTTIKTEKTSGFLISAEYRFYLVPGKQSLSGFHLGPQFAYQFTRSEMNETYDSGILNTYQVYRNLVTTHALAGYQLRITGPLYFNPAVGIGLRYISSRNENKKGSDPGQHEFPYNKDFESGAKWFPSVTINIKIGIIL